MKELMNISLVIDNLDIFYLISPSDIVSINKLILIMKTDYNITDKNSFEGRDRHNC